MCSRTSRGAGSTAGRPTRLLAWQAVVYAVFTLIALFALVRLRVGLNYSRENLVLMLTIYALAALPFFTGGLVITLAISRLASRVNAVYASDLLGAAAGCLILIPLLDRVGAPGVVLTAAALALTAAVLFAPAASRARLPAPAPRSWRWRSQASCRASRSSTWSSRRATRATPSCSASGIRFPGSASTNAPTATGR